MQIEILRNWCDRKKITYEEDIEKDIIHMRKKMKFEEDEKGRQVSINIFNIINIKNEDINLFLKGISTELNKI